MKSIRPSRARAVWLAVAFLCCGAATCPAACNITRMLVITNPTPAAADLFGADAAAVGTDKIVVSTYLDDTSGTNAGAAYLFDTSGTLLATVTNPLTVFTQKFGSAVAGLGSDRFLVAACDETTGNTNQGSVCLYNTSGALLVTITNPSPPYGDYFGCSIAGIGESRIAVGSLREDTGASDSGVVYLFETNGALQVTITNPAPQVFAQFGNDVAALGSDRLLVGCYRHEVGGVEVGQAYLYDLDGNILQVFTNPSPETTDGDFFGGTVCGVGADRIVIASSGKSNGFYYVGEVYIYDTNANLLVTVTNPSPRLAEYFGSEITAVGDSMFMVSVSSEHSTENYCGIAYLYDLSGNLLLTVINPTPGDNDYFGSAVAGLSADRVFISAYQDDHEDGVANSGAGYLYTLTSGDIQRYGFEDNKMGWEKSSDSGSTAVTNVLRTTDWAFTGTAALELMCDLKASPATCQKGEAWVDMEYEPPERRVLYPVDLRDRVVSMRVRCPDGAAGTNTQAWAHHRLMIFLKDTNWHSYYDTGHGIPSGANTVDLYLKVTTNTPEPWGYRDVGFDPSQIRSIGVKLEQKLEGGSYNGPIYIDHIAFDAPEYDPLYTNTQHFYDQETADQARYWKWDTNPDGWNATAWTSVYYAAGEGVDGSCALAADATFVTSGGDPERKGVFEIAYQPALNLSTKEHRRIQAKLRFDPALEDTYTFSVSVSVFDKITDQWYTKNFNAGGSGWNVLEFDLDNAAEYDAGSPVPMDASAIGYVVIQIYANNDWSGTVYLDEVVVGGVERGTDYATIDTGFVKAEGHKFTLDGSNFYHCGANIEYLFSVPDATCEELLDLAATCHVQAVRTWAFHEGQPYSFQPERGVWNELAFEHMDRIIAMAGDRGIRLMLGLADNWAHNGGVFQYMKWVQEEHPDSVDTNLDVEGVLFHDQFWTNAWAQQWYEDYVTVLLNRTNSITGRVYKDDPTIFAWEIVNEPRCESDFGGRTIHTWLWTNSDWVASIATNHILGGGEEGGYVNTYEFADTIPWEVYPDNYYHYAVHGVGSSTCDLYGCGRGHGVDFISDHSSVSNYVQWQDGTWSNRGTVYGEWRPGVSNLNFCTSRLYMDQKEYNLWRTNFNSSDQRIEWINDHWHDAHYRIGKPMILEEFGIHAIGWVYNGFYGQLQYPRTPELEIGDRVGIYGHFYRHIEKSGIPGSFFWNFGYSNMWEDPFHLCEEAAPWYAYTDEWAAVAVEVSTNHVIQGENGLRLAYDAAGASSNKAVYVCPTNEMWVLKVKSDGTNNVPMGINRVKFIWDFYNPTTAVDVALTIQGTDEGWLAECPAQTVTTGWNKITFNLSGGDWAWAGSGWLYDSYLLNITNAAGIGILEDVDEVGLVLYGLATNAPGDLYVDNVQIKRDDGFVIYANDPVCDVIRAHADVMGQRNIATNRANNVPVAGSIVVTADAFTATAVDLTAADTDGDPLSYRILERPANGWIFGTPPTNFLYKSKPGTETGDTFTYVAHDGMADSSVATVTVVIGSTDTDGDYLPDAWEYTHFPKWVQWWPYESEPLTNLFTSWDWDGDGQPDYNEWYAGTDPTNGASYLLVMGSNVSLDFEINWPSVDGKQYSLERSTNLVYGFDTVLKSNIVATAPMNTYTDATAIGLGTFLYRVEVE